MSSDQTNNSNQPPWFQGQSGGSQPSNPIPSSPSIREDQVVQAIRFLRDQRTQTATQQEKEAFLRQKGLTDAEIAAAISRCNPPAQSVGGNYHESSIQRPIYVPPPIVEEPILWSAIKSIFGALGAVAIGVIGYQYYLESTKKHQLEDPGSPLSKWKSNADESENAQRIDRLATSVEALKSEQALRHKELILSIRELTNVLKNSNVRKPGGTVVEADSIAVTDSLPLIEPVIEPILESVDILSEVSSLRESGLDTTLQLVLTSLDKNKKLNKTNPRFANFSGNKLLQLAGFKEGEDFWTLEEKNSTAIEEILTEIKRQRNSHVETLSVTDTAVGSQPVLPPWLVAKSEQTNP